MEANLFIQITGVQGSGKTTALNIIINALRDKGYLVFPVTESATAVLMSTESQIKGAHFSSECLKISNPKRLKP